MNAQNNEASTDFFVEAGNAPAEETKTATEQPGNAQMEEPKKTGIEMVSKYTLSKPVTVADKTYKVLDLNIDKLTGADIEEISSLPGCIENTTSTNELSKTFLYHIIARAANITIFDIRKFPLKDGSALAFSLQLYLMQDVPKVNLAKASKYKLIRPIKIGNKTICELSIDFENLSSDFGENISRLPGCNSGDSKMNEFSKTYLMHIVAGAAKITIDDVRNLSIRDCTTLTLAARNFLTDAASEIIVQ